MALPVLGIDGGQTGTRVLLASPRGAILGRGEGGPIRHLFGEGGSEARAAIEAAIRAAYADGELTPGPVAAAVCGITGVRSGTPEAAKVETAVRGVVGPQRLEVIPDYVTNLLGASNGAPGVVVVAGGGSVAYGVTADGREATAGGFGYLLDDAGSGYGIGRTALSAAIRAEDGRGESTALVGAVLDDFGVTDLEEIKAIVYAPGFDRSRITSLAWLVPVVAAGGDKVAELILVQAAAELALAAVAVIRRLFEPNETVTVYPTGGVFDAGALLMGPFEARLQAACPRAEIGTPANPPVVGALVRALRLGGYIPPASIVPTV